MRKGEGCRALLLPCYLLNIMREACFISLLLLTSQAGLGQAPNTAALPTDPHALLAAAEPLYDFSDRAMKPWHLKASYQLYDEQGKTGEQGTFEYWWVSPVVRRSSWTRPGEARTDWATEDGKVLRKESGGHIRYFERLLINVISSPLPDRGLVASGKMKLGLEQMPFGRMKLNCVTGMLPWTNSGTPEYLCFDPSMPAVRMTLANRITTEFNQLVRIERHYLARQVDVYVGKQKLFSVTVNSLDGLDPADPALIPAPDAVVAQAAVSQIALASSSDLAEVSIVSKVAPLYPAAANGSHEQGTVVLGATIGIDGKVREVEILASPSPRLSESSVSAVKQWQYRPYMVNGAAVELDTVLYVNYRLE